MLGLQTGYHSHLTFMWVPGIRTLFFTTKVVLVIALWEQRGLIFIPLGLLPLITSWTQTVSASGPQVSHRCVWISLSSRKHWQEMCVQSFVWFCKSDFVFQQSVREFSSFDNHGLKVVKDSHDCTGSMPLTTLEGVKNASRRVLKIGQIMNHVCMCNLTW